MPKTSKLEKKEQDAQKVLDDVAASGKHDDDSITKIAAALVELIPAKKGEQWQVAMFLSPRFAMIIKELSDDNYKKALSMQPKKLASVLFKLATKYIESGQMI